MISLRAARLPLAATLLVLTAVTANGCGTSGAPGQTGTGSLGETSPTATPVPTIPLLESGGPAGTGGAMGGGGGAAGGSGGPPVEYLPASWKLCQNQLRGSSMGYPGDWYTTSLSASDACSLFHPTSFTIPVAGEYPRVAMNAIQTQTTLDAYLTQTLDSTYVTVSLKANTTVAGRAAVKFEVTSTGEGLYEAGTRQYGYAIDRGGKAFVLYTIAGPGETRYNNWKFVIDTAKGTLRFL